MLSQALIISAIGILFANASCDGNRDIVEVAVIENVLGPEIRYPMTVARNAPVDIAITTYGDDCDRFERTDLEVQQDSARITPYNRRVYQELCSDSITLITHNASLEFSEAGTKSISIRGRRVGVEEEIVEIPIAIEIE